ncbi:MAG TPA: NADH-quinone oxidoreductase subunit C [Burkholderiaceae bacterium]|jgi:NADH-quinone oxidoreductase subunit C|nr:NADH-quinone oxidoreductase subunit C [Burkholderiaceae bacterium]
MNRLDELSERLKSALGDRLQTLVTALDEVTIVIKAPDHLSVARTLGDDPMLGFEQLIDLCGVDYFSYGEGAWDGPRYAVVMHLLSLKHNWRVRVRSFCPDDDLPLIESVTGIWAAANWFEREAFDLYGIVFEGHPDLRRLLTDYGFVGHPFRKDFPISGYVEMRYDPEQRRVIYQPVTIEPREIVPRVIREETYGQGRT